MMNRFPSLSVLMPWKIEVWQTNEQTEGLLDMKFEVAI